MASKMPLQLQKSYLSGKVAKRIRWGTKGDYGRCVKQAMKHGIPSPVAKGMCQTLHKKATGMYTGDAKHLGKQKRGRNVSGRKIRK